MWMWPSGKLKRMGKRTDYSSQMQLKCFVPNSSSFINSKTLVYKWWSKWCHILIFQGYTHLKRKNKNQPSDHVNKNTVFKVLQESVSKCSFSKANFMLTRPDSHSAPFNSVIQTCTVMETRPSTWATVQVHFLPKKKKKRQYPFTFAFHLKISHFIEISC